MNIRFYSRGRLQSKLFLFPPFFFFRIDAFHPKNSPARKGENRREEKGRKGTRREEEAKSVKGRSVIIPLNRDRIRVHSACYYAPGRCLGDVEWKHAGRQLPPRLLPLFSPCSWTVDNESDVAETNATIK